MVARTVARHPFGIMIICVRTAWLFALFNPPAPLGGLRHGPARLPAGSSDKSVEPSDHQVDARFRRRSAPAPTRTAEPTRPRAG